MDEEGLGKRLARLKSKTLLTALLEKPALSAEERQLLIELLSRPEEQPDGESQENQPPQ